MAVVLLLPLTAKATMTILADQVAMEEVPVPVAVEVQEVVVAMVEAVIVNQAIHRLIRPRPTRARRCPRRTDLQVTQVLPQGVVARMTAQATRRRKLKS